jgi:POT family proton-dependent oligopeptide transporter
MSDYGTIAAYTNFVVKKRRMLSGAAFEPNSDEAVRDGLRIGKNIAFSLTTFHAYWVYYCPLVGAWKADAYLVRFVSIVYSVIVAEMYIFFVASSARSVPDKPDTAIGALVITILMVGLGNQYLQIKHFATWYRMRVELQGHERVIVDPAVTVTQIYNFFYVSIDIGPLIGQTSMVFAELCVGFWFAHLLPTVMFVVCSPVPLRLQEVLYPKASERQYYGAYLQVSLRGSQPGR